MQVIVSRDNDAALALHRLQKDGGRAVRGGIHNGFHIVKVHMDKAGQQGSKGFLIVRLAGGGHGGHRAPVEGTESGDDFISPVPVQLAVAPGQFQRALVGLGPAVAEKHPIQAAVFHQQLGQLQLRHGVELVGGLQQGAGLLDDGLGHRRMGMAQVVHGPAGDKVQIFLAVGVPDPGAFAAHDDHRLAAHRLGVIAVLDGNPVAADAHNYSPLKVWRRFSRDCSRSVSSPSSWPRACSIS